MPELPEIEVAKRRLAKVLVKKIITAVYGDVPKLVTPNMATFAKLVKGAAISKVERRAKLLICKLDIDWWVLIHLKLTGQLVYQKKNQPLLMVGHPMEKLRSVPNQFTHLVFKFSNGSKLYLNDLRKFAYVKLVKPGAFRDLKLGIEPLSRKLTHKYLKNLLVRHPKMRVKHFLHDQTLICGIGNIYSDEILFSARVKPSRLAGTITDAEAKRIVYATKKILSEAIAHGSTSYNPYIGETKLLNHNKYLKVYQRNGRHCPRNDGGKICREKINGRSAHFCSICQK